METKFSRSAVVVVVSEVGGRNLLIVVLADPLVGTLAFDSGIGTGPTREVKLGGNVRAVVVAVPVDASSDEGWASVAVVGSLGTGRILVGFVCSAAGG